MKALTLFAVSLFASGAFGQNGARPFLLVDVSGNPYPNGSGTPLPYTPASMICYTLSAGSILPCNFAAGGGGDTITSPNSTLSVGGTATATTLDINLAHANTWTALQTMSSLKIGSGQAMTAPPEMVAYYGQLNVSTVSSNTSVPLTPVSPITITRVEWSLPTEAVTCTTTPIVTVTVAGTASAYTVPMTTVASSFSGHVDSTLNVAANSAIGLRTTTASACSTQPGNPFLVVHYIMQ
jgi:hypothetical protein